MGVDAFMRNTKHPILLRAIKRLTSEDAKRHVRRITNRSSSPSCSTATVREVDSQIQPQ